MVKKGLAIRHEPNRPDPTRPDRGQKLFWNYRFSHVFFSRLFDPACLFNFLPERAKQTINFAVSFGECYEVKIKWGFGCWISTPRKLAGGNATSTYSNQMSLVTAHAKGPISVTLLRAVILTLDIVLVSTSEYPLHEHSGLKNARIPL